MRASTRAFKMIQNYEDFRSHMYNCPANHCTIGYGHLIHMGPIDGRPEEKPWEGGISEERACELLRSDVACKVEHYLDLYVRAALNQNQYDALVDFTYNLGNGALLGSTLLKKLNVGDYARAAEEFPKWNHASGRILSGLTKRRLEEQALFCEAIGA